MPDDRGCRPNRPASLGVDPPGVVFVGTHAETFTPTSSGAVATIMYEISRQALANGLRPLVLARHSLLPAYAGVQALFFEELPQPRGRVATLALRAERKLRSLRYFHQGRWISAVTTLLAPYASATWVLNNEPELAVALRYRFPGTRIIHHFHNVLECKALARRRYGAAALTTTAVSDYTARWVEGYYGLRPGSASTVYNGVDTEKFSPAESLPPLPPVVNYVGRTGIEKGPDILLEAALLLAQKGLKFKLQLIGSNHWDRFELDDYQRKLAALVKKLEGLGIPVRRPGHIGRAALPNELRKAHISVLSTRCVESFGMATLEAMACGLATVASNTGGTPEVVGDAGLLFERENVNQLAEQLQRLITDENLRRRIAARCRRRAESMTWENSWRSLAATLAPPRPAEATVAPQNRG